MENESLRDDLNPATRADVTAEPAADVAVDDLLEDVSIDGMCGVY